MPKSKSLRQSSKVTVPVWERVAIFGFGVVFIIALLLLAIIFPQPTPFQYTVFRIVLALAGAGIAALIPGFIEVEIELAYKNVIRAGGALGVFIVLYFFSPASLVARPSVLPKDVTANVQYSLYDGNLSREAASKPDGWPPPDSFLASSTKMQVLITKKAWSHPETVFASDLPHEPGDVFLISRSVTAASMVNVSNDGGPGFSLNRGYGAFTGNMGQFMEERGWCDARVLANIYFEPASGLDNWILPPHDVTSHPSFLSKYGLTSEFVSSTSSTYEDYDLGGRIQLYVNGQQVAEIWGSVYKVHLGGGGFTPTLRLGVFDGKVDCKRFPPQ